MTLPTCLDSARFQSARASLALHRAACIFQPPLPHSLSLHPSPPLTALCILISPLYPVYVLLCCCSAAFCRLFLPSGRTAALPPTHIPHIASCPVAPSPQCPSPAHSDDSCLAILHGVYLQAPGASQQLRQYSAGLQEKQCGSWQGRGQAAGHMLCQTVLKIGEGTGSLRASVWS